MTPQSITELELIEEAAGDRNAHIIDVGAGESTLVDDLLRRGYRNVCLLDLSSTALEVAKARLGADAVRINWLCGDIRTLALGHHQFDLWHDRAVFHFLTDANDRVAYVRQVAHAVKPGGHVIVATFGPEGPTKCSGLDVVRFAPNADGHDAGVYLLLLQSFKLAGRLRTARPLNLRVRTAVLVVPIAAI